MHLECRIIIPSHNRQHLFTELDAYYQNIDIPISIIDSTSVPYGSTLNNIDYFHYPQKDFPTKLKEYSSLIDEYNIIMVADDDKLILENIYDTYSSHIESNALVTSGNILAFRDGVLVNKRLVPIIKKEDLYTDHLKKYHQILWGVYNTDHFVKVYDIISKCKFRNHNFIEFTIAVISSFNHNINYIDKFFLKRIQDDNSWGRQHKSLTMAGSLRDFYALIKYSKKVVPIKHTIKCYVSYLKS